MIITLNIRPQKQISNDKPPITLTVNPCSSGEKDCKLIIQTLKLNVKANSQLDLSLEFYRTDEDVTSVHKPGRVDYLMSGSWL